MVWFSRVNLEELRTALHLECQTLSSFFHNSNPTMSNRSTAFKRCEKCGKQSEKPSRCSQCQVMYYCDKDCQKKNWQEHKSICKEIREFPLFYFHYKYRETYQRTVNALTLMREKPHYVLFQEDSKGSAASWFDKAEKVLVHIKPQIDEQKFHRIVEYAAKCRAESTGTDVMCMIVQSLHNKMKVAITVVSANKDFGTYDISWKLEQTEKNRNTAKQSNK